VTFTEAAAAELRVRVREGLTDVAGGAEGSEPGPAAEAQSEPEDERRRARRALDHIDEGAISTIHGFCQRLLAEHPIESGLPPRFEVLDEVQQSLEWRKQWSDGLDAFGEDAGYRGLFQVASLLSVTRIEELVRDVAEEWDHCGTEPPDGLAVVAAVEAIVTRAAAMVVAALDHGARAGRSIARTRRTGSPSGWAISGRIGTSWPGRRDGRTSWRPWSRKFVSGGRSQQGFPGCVT